MLRFIFMLCLAAPVSAQTFTTENYDPGDGDGVLNPEELSMRGALDRMRYGERHPMMGIIGYGAAKEGNHAVAREIFEELSQNGDVQGMTWLSWMEDNGLGAPENPKAAAELDRRAMELGSEVAAFNYGLDLMRGRGVAMDQDAGRQIIDQAAKMGSATAQHLIDNDYDLDSVTPDADNWKYEPNFF